MSYRDYSFLIRAEIEHFSGNGKNKQGKKTSRQQLGGVDEARQESASTALESVKQKRRVMEQNLPEELVGSQQQEEKINWCVIWDRWKKNRRVTFKIVQSVNKEFHFSFTQNKENLKARSGFLTVCIRQRRKLS